MGDVIDDRVSKTKSQSRPRDREYQALREHLTDEPAAACAQSAAHGEFLASSRGAAQLKVGKIDAHDQKDCADGEPQDNERAAELATYVVLQSGQVGSIVLIPVGVNYFEMRKQAIRLIL